MVSVYDISKQYSETLTKQISENQTLEYRDSNLLQSGKYTIFAYSMSGQISKPIVVEITNVTTTPTSYSSLSNTIDGIKSAFNTNSGFSLMSLFTIPAIFGGVMIFNRQKSIKFSFNIAAIMAIIVFSAFTTSGGNQAFATYNVSSQGVEEHSTLTSFTNAAVQEGFEGVKTDTGSANGLSVQNNQFVNGFTTGTGYLWVQSFIQQEISNVATFNSHTCTTQAGSYTCQLPSTMNIRGIYNYWTHQDNNGNCPSSSWTHSGFECYLAPTSAAWTGISLAGDVRVDLYAYQELQISGNVFQVQKYRTCTSTSSCSVYSQLATDTRAFVSTTAYYAPTTYFGGSTYGIAAVVGECGTCGTSGNGKVTFYDGTYGTLTFTPYTSGTPQYRASGSTLAPSENNIHFCWWDTIGNTGGTTPTITATGIYSASCSS
jgi:hypothetical protein